MDIRSCNIKNSHFCKNNKKIEYINKIICKSDNEYLEIKYCIRLANR